MSSKAYKKGKRKGRKEVINALKAMPCQIKLRGRWFLETVHDSKCPKCLYLKRLEGEQND
jgi:hypothetical protein